MKGNKRLSDEAIVNYSRIRPGNNISSEDLNDAYKKIIEYWSFQKTLALNNLIKNLIISVEEYPTVNEISFEGNKKFTDEKLIFFY